MNQKQVDLALSFGRHFIREGHVADYIPELAKVDKGRAGICVMTKDGEVFSAGNVDDYFTIQSISKIINLGVALQTCGYEHVFAKVKMEPSGDAFNSIIKLDTDGHIPFNPMINSGAIVVTSFLQPEFTFDEMLEWTKKLCMDDTLTLDEDVYHSELATGDRNRSIAYLLKSNNVISGNIEEILDLYFKMCSIRVTAKSLAGLGLVLANNGVNPFTEERLLDHRVVTMLKTLMLTCGMYDGSGEFAAKVGMPAKSGVGGGILSFVNHKAGIGTFGPSLDSKGNSIVGMKMMEYLSQELHLHIFDYEPEI